MISNKAIFIMIIIAVLLLGASLWINYSVSNSSQETGEETEDGETNPVGGLNLVINPQENTSGETG